MSGFDIKLAKAMGVEKITGLDKFSLFSGTIGLIVDIAAMVGLAGGLVLPNMPIPDKVPTGGLLLTAFLGFYSLTLVIWFLIRFERAKRIRLGIIDEDVAVRTFDRVNTEMEGAIGILLIPVIGTFLLFFIMKQ